MNPEILKNAAVYVNAYRANNERNARVTDAAALRSHVTRLFGDVYAAILVH